MVLLKEKKLINIIFFIFFYFFLFFLFKKNKKMLLTKGRQTLLSSNLLEIPVSRIPSSSSATSSSLKKIKEISNISFYQTGTFNIHKDEIVCDSDFVYWIGPSRVSKKNTYDLRIYGIQNNEEFIVDGNRCKVYVQGSGFRLSHHGQIWETFAPRREFSQPTRKIDLQQVSLTLRLDSVCLAGQTVLSLCGEGIFPQGSIPVFTLYVAEHARMQTAIPAKKIHIVTRDYGHVSGYLPVPHQVAQRGKSRFWTLESLVLKCSGNSIIEGIAVTRALELDVTNRDVQHVKVALCITQECKFKEPPLVRQLPENVIIIPTTRPIVRREQSSYRDEVNTVIENYRSIIHSTDRFRPPSSQRSSSSSSSSSSADLYSLSVESHLDDLYGKDGTLSRSKKQKTNSANFKLTGCQSVKDMIASTGMIACSICMTNVPRIVFDPCGHKCVCFTCTQDMQHGGKAQSCTICPICRTPISKAISYYEHEGILVESSSSDASISSSSSSFLLKGDLETQDVERSMLPYAPFCRKCLKNIARVIFECGDCCCCVSCALEFKTRIYCFDPDCKKEVGFGTIMK
jgi:hypothetical protein